VLDQLFSPYWYRVESLRPRLRAHAQIHRRRFRGELWYVIEDPTTQRHHRFGAGTYYLIALMDGARSVGEIWEAASTQLGDAAPTQGQVIQLLAQLHSADVLACDVSPDHGELFHRFLHGLQPGLLRRVMNPLWVRVPLLDPDRWLERGARFVRPLFSTPGLIIWAGVVLAGLIGATMHAAELAASGLDRVLEPNGLLLLGLTYIVVKALHELGHGFAVKVWGGAVHEVGILFLVFMPIPYVDASAASSFEDRWRRIVVSGAGIMAELWLSSAALFLWLAVEPGVVRTLAWNVMLIGGTSTLLFNGNPLLRFDGYYVLSDALEIPNLAARSKSYVAYLFQYRVLGLPERRHQHHAPGERGWLATYGVAAFVYRLFISVAIALFIAGKFFVIGVALALLCLATQVAVPLGRSVHHMWVNDPRFREHRGPTLLRLAGVGAALAAILMAPLPSATRGEGVVWPPEHSQVRAGTDGFVREVLVAPDSRVERGQALLILEDPMLQKRVRVLEARVRELRARYQAERQDDSLRAELVREELHAVQASLEQSRERLAAAIARSPADGRFFLPRASELPARFVRRGELLGYVTDLEAPTVRAVVSAVEIARVRERTIGVEVRLADQVAEVLPAEIRLQVPTATTALPSAALGAAGGGRIGVDASDEQGLTAAEKVFVLDLALPREARVVGLGQRAYVRFRHPPEPLALRLISGVRRLFLARFHV
jgi:putative peptide zinc metalloprotease protein